MPNIIAIKGQGYCWPLIQHKSLLQLELSLVTDNNGTSIIFLQFIFDFAITVSKCEYLRQLRGGVLFNTRSLATKLPEYRISYKTIYEGICLY